MTRDDLAKAGLTLCDEIEELMAEGEIEHQALVRAAQVGKLMNKLAELPLALKILPADNRLVEDCHNINPASANSLGPLLNGPAKNERSWGEGTLVCWDWNECKVGGNTITRYFGLSTPLRLVLQSL